MSDLGVDTQLPTILSLSEAAEFLGFSEGGLRRILARGDIPARKVGRRWLLSRPVLEKWAEGQ